MQKINIILPALFLASFYLQAAQETPVNAIPAPVPQQTDTVTPPDAAEATAPVTAGQEQIVRALQDDIVFERQKRQLSNELALEKLRAELQKVRGENTPAITMPAAPPPVAIPARDESSVPAPVAESAPPRVILVSQVAGISRVGVSVNGQLRFVGRNETFPANGTKYRLVPAKNNQLVAREVK
ncbi:TPA: lngG [Salmonella enterica subsp. enterica serovar Muenchen]|uniref:LngG n=1 Tax=Salmonella enterica TaxID=28901 RepID=A0A403T4Q0_SALER|nr:lngG [Salmonella enterica]ECJ2364043.1 lngG [Salmonella enterica subsp. diarizonae]EDL3490745.1 lngG [Salmonella enterica subsp. enterica serovar Newport]HBM0024333.1 lngG [Salmonella enterica subsp. enterica serovar Muenchen]ECJ2414082.1 lngG [Salmonella enterica subsp. diarizonae]